MHLDSALCFCERESLRTWMYAVVGTLYRSGERTVGGKVKFGSLNSGPESETGSGVTSLSDADDFPKRHSAK